MDLFFEYLVEWLHPQAQGSKQNRCSDWSGWPMGTFFQNVWRASIFTPAEHPPTVDSVHHLCVDDTRTVPSFDEDARALEDGQMGFWSKTFIRERIVMKVCKYKRMYSRLPLRNGWDSVKIVSTIWHVHTWRSWCFQVYAGNPTFMDWEFVWG